MSTIFDIIKKEDSVERLNAVANIDPKYILFAPEVNAVVDALKKLVPKGMYLNNTAAMDAGLEAGDIYYLPNHGDNNMLAIVKSSATISLIDIEGDKFTDIISAREYINHYTIAEISNESYSSGIYRFNIPFGSNFSESNNFCSVIDGGHRLRFIDEQGAIYNFGNLSFKGNTQNNVFGNCSFGDGSFIESTGNNSFGNCSFGNYCFTESTGDNTFENTSAKNAFFKKSTGNNSFGNIKTNVEAFSSTTGEYHFKNCLFLNNKNFNDAKGVYYFNGDLGSDNLLNFGEDFFFDQEASTIHALVEKEISNGGEMDGDLQRASDHGVNVIFDL